MTPVAEPRAATHDVVFFETDDELVRVAGDRLSGALAAGSEVVLIATPHHLRALQERIRETGVDLDTAVSDGSLLALDAAETLGRLTPAGVFDPDAFDHVIGGIVRAAAERRTVHAFGEMVALLWDEGRVQEAVELEAAWEGLVQETSAALLCAYPGTVVDDGGVPLKGVCDLHSSVLGDAPLERTWSFPADVAAAGGARRLVTNALRARGVSGQVLDDAEVVVAELVANAVVHGRSPFRVDVTIDRDRVHVRVEDQGSDVPTFRPLDPIAPSGRGLHLLSALTSRWGVERLPLGKLVWAELPR